jgi:diguanylate cyclase (GGDEF)-like protein/PAS domain S-box-containing protein
MALLALLVATGAWLSVTWTGRPGELSALWIPGGLLCAWLLMRPRDTWLAYGAVGVAADVVGQLIAATPLGLALALSCCHLIEVIVVAHFIRRSVPDIRDPRHWVNLGGVATASTMLACAVSGAMAAQIARVMLGSDPLLTFASWYGAHVLGMVIVGTTALVIQVEGVRSLAPPGRRVGFVLSMMLVAVIAALAFVSDYPLLFLTYPPLLLGAFRHRFGGVAVGASLLALIGVTLTTAGYGPLAQVAVPEAAWRMLLLQLYLAGGCLITLPVVLAMAERDRLTARVRDSEQRYRLLADYSGDLVVRLNPSGERTYVSPSAREMLGWAPDEMLGTRWDLIHPDDREAQRQAMREVVASGLSQTHRYRVRHRDGRHVWTEVVMRSAPRSGPDGETDLILSGRDISKRVAAEQALEASRQELQRLTLIDALTGIGNRRQLEHRLALAMAGLGRDGLAVALFFLDIDHFKGVNDTHGHATGDGVIRTFAQRLQTHVGAGGLVVRLGGDEFVILLDGDITPASVMKLARKLLIAVRAPMRVVDRTITVTTSIGIAFADAVASEDDLLSAADEALYKAKSKGRDRYEVALVAATSARDEGHHAAAVDARWMGPGTGHRNGQGAG